MQADDVIWLLAGIGIGLVIAMLMLAAMLVIDGRRLQRRASATGELLRSAAPEPKAEPAPARKVALVPETPRRATVPRPAPPAPQREPVVADAKPSEPAAAVIVDELMTDLAAEIARVQTVEPVVVNIDPPPAVTAVPAPSPPDPVAAAPSPIAPAAEPAPTVTPAPEPVLTAPLEVSTESPADPAPIVAAPPAEDLAEAPIVVTPPPAPKVPPLPKVTPARKFAPALPPRSPQEGGKA